MTLVSLKTGSTCGRFVRVVGAYSRWSVMLAVVGMLSAHSAFAQRSLASVLLPSDTSGPKKLIAPKTPPATKANASAFAHEQLQNERVADALVAKRMELKQLFRARGLKYPSAEIFMRVFKRERQLEMWVRPEGADTFVMLKSYDICALSEKPGPKRNRGDLQTPEGFYFIDNFNPVSGYHLSLRVNYPNEADRAMGAGKDLGGDIFIHGGCKTAGCMAVTNENIKEIYWLAVEARDHGQSRIPVHIFPARLSDNNLKQYENVFGANNDLIRFWSNIKRGYDLFEQTHKLAPVSVNRNGRYVFGPDSDPLLGKPAVAAKPAATTDTVAQH